MYALLILLGDHEIPSLALTSSGGITKQYRSFFEFSYSMAGFIPDSCNYPTNIERFALLKKFEELLQRQADDALSRVNIWGND